MEFIEIADAAHAKGLGVRVLLNRMYVLSDHLGGCTIHATLADLARAVARA
ncbi:hypothetical protein ACXU40_09295 [Bordetella bronchiseptica]